MPRAFRYLLAVAAIAALSTAAERKSWNKVRYVGGTVPVKTSPYDWNTTVTITSNPDAVTIAIAPSSVFGHQQTVQFKASQVTSVVSGPGAWQRVADIPGAQLPAKPASLFGLVLNHAFLGILYQGDDGKPAGILLDSYVGSQISRVLEVLTGKPTEYVK